MDALATSPVVKAVTLSKNPVGYWRLNETSGTTANDSSGNAHNGIISANVARGAVGLPGDPASTTMTFDGATGFVDVPGGASLGFTGPFSVTAWINPTSVNPAGQAGFPTVVCKPNSIGDNFRIFLGNGAGDGGLSIRYQGTGGLQQFATAGGAIVAGTLYHVAEVYDGTFLDGYINGVRVIHGSPTSAPAASDARDLDIGQSATVANRFFAGRIGEVAVFNYGLSLADISDLYLAGKTALGALAVATDANV